MNEFKPKGERISSKEKLSLFNKNLAWCPVCKTVKSIGEMSVRVKSQYGTGSNCKSCENIIAEKRRILKREKMRVNDDYAETERAKDRIYRAAKRVEKRENTTECVFNNPLEFKPRGLKISNAEADGLLKAGYKWCPSCESPKTIDSFSKSTCYCKLCSSVKMKTNENIRKSRIAYYEKNRESILRNVSKYRANNISAIKGLRVAYYETNKEKILERNRLYRELNIEKVKASQLEYRKRNSEKIKARAKRWRSANVDKVARQRRERYSNDVEYKLQCACRQFVRRMVLSTGTRKTFKTQEVLGYTPQELKLHIEAQFKTGMTWDNYGDWHIDHIIPISSAKTLYDGIRLSQLDNLQPLWAEENSIKGNKIINFDN